MKRFFLISWFALLPVLMGGCGVVDGGQGCAAVALPAIIVEVTDAATGANAAPGATVVVTDGNFSETLQVYSSTYVEGETLSYGGALERSGTYTVRVTKAGYEPWVRRGVRVNRGDCGVQTRTVKAELTPAS